MSESARRSQSGFTLLEMLAAIAITALLITGAVEAHIQLLQAQRARIYERGRDVTAQRVLDRMERELLSSLLVGKPEKAPREGHPWVFQGFNGEPADRRSDAIRFITYNTRRSDVGAGLRMVSYRGEADERDQMDLYRDEGPLADGLPGKLGAVQGAPALRGVHQLELRYQDEAGNWLDTWDSTAQDTLPLAVEITLQLAEKNLEGEIVLGTAVQRVVPLVVRPIGAKAEKMCKTGGTVRACAAQLAAVIAALPAEGQQAVRGLVEAAGDQCVKDEKPPETLQVLRQALSASGVQLDEICP